MGEGVLKKHIYLWTINIEYSCRETFFQVYTLRVGVSSKIRDKKQGGRYEVTIQDIITERIYWRQFKTKSNFDRYFTILFEVDKNLRGGEFTLLTLV